MKILTYLGMVMAVGMAAAAAAPAASAAEYPSRPGRIVVPYPAGSNSDTLARCLGERLGKRLGQPVIVENRGGAGGSIGTQMVVSSAPDGYTLLLHSGAIATEAAVRKNLPYDVSKDLVPIAKLTDGPNVLLVHPDLPVKTTAELIAYARAKPGTINFGSPGPNTSIHLSTELFKAMAKITIVHVRSEEPHV